MWLLRTMRVDVVNASLFAEEITIETEAWLTIVLFALRRFTLYDGKVQKSFTHGGNLSWTGTVVSSVEPKLLRLTSLSLINSASSFEPRSVELPCSFWLGYLSGDHVNNSKYKGLDFWSHGSRFLTKEVYSKRKSISSMSRSATELHDYFNMKTPGTRKQEIKLSGDGGCQAMIPSRN